MTYQLRVLRLPRFGFLILAMLTLGACSGRNQPAPQPTKPEIAVTHAILASLIQDLVGDQCLVISIIPNGQDPHDWEPSAQEMAGLRQASLIVENGLGLEGGLEKSLQLMRDAGQRFFTAADQITIRRVKKGEGVSSTDPDQQPGAPDPHLWTDPLAMKAMVAALGPTIAQILGIDLSRQTAALVRRLETLDNQIRGAVNTLPPARRLLVTGHESLGYFAERYGFRLVGAVVPSLSTQAESSAGELAALKKLIVSTGTPVIFTEQGTSPRVVTALAEDSRVRAVELLTHRLPADGSYFTFMTELADRIVTNLR